MPTTHWPMLLPILVRMATSGSSPSRNRREYTSGQSQNWCGFSLIDEKRHSLLVGGMLGLTTPSLSYITLATPLHTFMQQPLPLDTSLGSLCHTSLHSHARPSRPGTLLCTLMITQLFVAMLHFLYTSHWLRCSCPFFSLYSYINPMHNSLFKLHIFGILCLHSFVSLCHISLTVKNGVFQNSCLGCLNVHSSTTPNRVFLKPPFEGVTGHPQITLTSLTSGNESFKGVLQILTLY